MFLSRDVGNNFGAEGVGILAEPLGKLTALRELNLICNVWAFCIRGIEGDVAWGGAMHFVCVCFSVAF